MDVRLLVAGFSHGLNERHRGGSRYGETIGRFRSFFGGREVMSKSRKMKTKAELAGEVSERKRRACCSMSILLVAQDREPIFGLYRRPAGRQAGVN